MNPTTEQSAILAAATGSSTNLSISALAGTGKSSTLRMIERKVRTKPCLYLAFNAKVVKEIEFDPKAKPEEAAKRMTSTTSVRTFNSIGHRIWAQTTGKNLSLTRDKTQKILRGIIDDLPKGTARDEAWAVFWNVVDAVGMAKSLGYVPEGKFPNAKRLIPTGDFHAALDEAPDDLTADLIDLVLFRSIQQGHAGTIDFNDQVYLPAIFGGKYPQYPLVFVDEAQDLNPVNHEMLSRLVTGRVIIVGDPAQSIYGFRGAVEGGMESLATRFNTTTLPLTITFRCPQSIVNAVLWRVPDYKSVKPGGDYAVLSDLDFVNVPDDSVILCRNNAPLLSVAFRALASGRSVSVAGSDIGPKLVGIMRKLGPDDMTQAQTLGAIDNWLARKEDKGSKSAHDLAACMRVFANHGTSLATAILYAEHLFAQSGTIRLMTGHKAKGLEFPFVYHLDPWLCSDDPQDRNLRYVITTRSMDTLYEVDSSVIKW